MIESVLLILLGYLLGSIPASYLAGRWSKGLDLRRYGSGTVSGSMVYEHVARWMVVPVGLFDIAKAAFPTWLGWEFLWDARVAAAAGLAAAVGHNWPVYLRFTGGRGLSCFLGIWLILYKPGIPWMLGFLLVGWLLGDSAPWALASLATMPLLSLFTGGVDLVTPVAAAMLLLTLAKRLEANRRPLPPRGPERRKVILYRLLFDRDIAGHKEWIRRTPDQGDETSPGNSAP